MLGTARSSGAPPTATVFYLHGLTSTGSSGGLLKRCLSRLSPEVNVQLIDLPGHGQSRRPLTPSDTMQTIAKQLLADLVESSDGSSQIHLVGHSFGGLVALSTAKLAPPDGVRSVCLLDMTPGPLCPAQGNASPLLSALSEGPQQFPTLKAAKAHLQDVVKTLDYVPVGDRWLMRYLRWVGPADSTESANGNYTWRTPPTTLMKLWKERSAVDDWAWLNALPTDKRRALLCVRPPGSPFVTDESVARLTAYGARVVSVPGAGHSPHVSHALCVARHLIDFWHTLDVGGRSVSPAVDPLVETSGP